MNIGLQLGKNQLLLRAFVLLLALALLLPPTTGSAVIMPPGGGEGGDEEETPIVLMPSMAPTIGQWERFRVHKAFKTGPADDEGNGLRVVFRLDLSLGGTGAGTNTIRITLPQTVPQESLQLDGGVQLLLRSGNPMELPATLAASIDENIDESYQLVIELPEEFELVENYGEGFFIPYYELFVPMNAPLAGDVHGPFIFDTSHPEQFNYETIIVEPLQGLQVEAPYTLGTAYRAPLTVSFTVPSASEVSSFDVLVALPEGLIFDDEDSGLEGWQPFEVTLGGQVLENYALLSDRLLLVTIYDEMFTPGEPLNVELVLSNVRQYYSMWQDEHVRVALKVDLDPWFGTAVFEGEGNEGEGNAEGQDEGEEEWWVDPAVPVWVGAKVTTTGQQGPPVLPVPILEGYAQRAYYTCAFCAHGVTLVFPATEAELGRYSFKVVLPEALQESDLDLAGLMYSNVELGGQRVPVGVEYDPSDHALYVTLLAPGQVPGEGSGQELGQGQVPEPEPVGLAFVNELFIPTTAPVPSGLLVFEVSSVYEGPVHVVETDERIGELAAEWSNFRLNGETTLDVTFVYDGDLIPMPLEPVYGEGFPQLWDELVLDLPEGTILSEETTVTVNGVVVEFETEVLEDAHLDGTRRLTFPVPELGLGGSGWQGGHEVSGGQEGQGVPVEVHIAGLTQPLVGEGLYMAVGVKRGSRTDFVGLLVQYVDDFLLADRLAVLEGLNIHEADVGDAYAQYAPAAVSAFRDQIDAAQAVLENLTATQATVDAQLAELNAAYGSLLASVRNPVIESAVEEEAVWASGNELVRQIRVEFDGPIADIEMFVKNALQPWEDWVTGVRLEGSTVTVERVFIDSNVPNVLLLRLSDALTLGEADAIRLIFEPGALVLRKTQGYEPVLNGAAVENVVTLLNGGDEEPGGSESEPEPEPEPDTGPFDILRERVEVLDGLITELHVGDNVYGKYTVTAYNAYRLALDAASDLLVLWDTEGAEVEPADAASALVALDEAYAAMLASVPGPSIVSIQEKTYTGYTGFTEGYGAEGTAVVSALLVRFDKPYASYNWNESPGDSLVLEGSGASIIEVLWDSWTHELVLYLSGPLTLQEGAEEVRLRILPGALILTEDYGGYEERYWSVMNGSEITGTVIREGQLNALRESLAALVQQPGSKPDGGSVLKLLNTTSSDMPLGISRNEFARLLLAMIRADEGDGAELPSGDVRG